MDRSRTIRVWPLLLTPLFFAPSSFAQVIVEQPREDVPALVGLTPIAIQLGRSQEVSVKGERLDDLSGVLCEAFEVEEITANDAKSATIRLKTVPGTAPGIYPLHLLCNAGLSNPRMIVVDTIPQCLEVEENNSPGQATPVDLPCGAMGVLTPNDRDHFRFRAAAGETLRFDLRAARIGSPLSGVLTLFNGEGLELCKISVPPPDIAPDVRLEHTFEQAGDYVIGVHDQTYQGADYAAYQLRIVPAKQAETIYAAAMYPLGGRRGESVEVELSEGNLTQPLIHHIDLSAPIDWNTRRLEIPTKQGVVVAPALFAVGSHPEYLEQESNDDSTHAETVALPVTINGRLHPSEDRDCFRFRAVTGEKLIFEVFAERLGIPLDAVLVVKDNKGKTVGEADDTTLVERIPPVIRSANDVGITDDPRFEFTAPNDGEYVVEISNRLGDGDAPLPYRLEICQQQQDFELIVQPGRVDNPDPNNRRRNRAQQVMQQFDGHGGGALSIDRGGRGSLVVRAVRRGYQGPIALSAVGLPSGLQTRPATILGGQSQTLVDFLADFDADSVAAFVNVTGTAEFEGRTQTRRARQPVVFSALPLGAVAQQQLDTVAVGISGQGAELALRGKLAGPVTPGESAQVHVELRRREGILGDVSLQAVSLPAGLSLAPLTVGEKQTELDVPLVVAADIAPGKRTFQIEGQLVVKDEKNGKGDKRKKNKEKDTNEPLAAIASIEIDVRPLLVVELLTQTLEIEPGGAARLDFNIQRNGSEPLPIALDVSRLPGGLSLAESTIPAEAAKFVLTLSAAADARPSPLPRIVQFKPVVETAGGRLELPTQRVVIKIVKPTM